MSRLDDYQNRLAMIVLVHKDKTEAPQNGPPVKVSLDQIREYAEIVVQHHVDPETSRATRAWEVAGYTEEGRRTVIVDGISSESLADAWARRLADLVVEMDLGQIHRP